MSDIDPSAQTQPPHGLPAGSIGSAAASAGAGARAARDSGSGNASAGMLAGSGSGGAGAGASAANGGGGNGSVNGAGRDATTSGSSAAGTRAPGAAGTMAGRPPDPAPQMSTPAPTPSPTPLPPPEPMPAPAPTPAPTPMPMPAPTPAPVPSPPPVPARAPAPNRAGQLVITEIMVDPKTSSDAQGEWFELKNTTNTTFDLEGCVLDDGAAQPTPIATSVLVQPLQYLTIARYEQPGFAPNAVASVSFTNGADSIALLCSELEIDRVSYDKSLGFALVAGASMSLDRDRIDSTANDDAGAWCVATQSYGPELGTPGTANAPCNEASEDAGVATDEP